MKLVYYICISWEELRTLRNSGTQLGRTTTELVIGKVYDFKVSKKQE